MMYVPRHLIVNGGKANNERSVMATQYKRLEKVFRDSPNEWIPLPRILLMGLAQYGARILELRKSGMDIKNKVERVNGTTHSWFMYVPQHKAIQREMFA